TRRQERGLTTGNAQGDTEAATSEGSVPLVAVGLDARGSVCNLLATQHPGENSGVPGNSDSAELHGSQGGIDHDTRETSQHHDRSGTRPDRRDDGLPGDRGAQTPALMHTIHATVVSPYQALTPTLDAD